MLKQILLTLLLLFICSVASHPQSIAGNAGAANDNRTGKLSEAASEGAGAETYVIAPEDILRIEVWREPTLSNPKVTVRADGKISLVLLDDVQAGGLTPIQ